MPLTKKGKKIMRAMKSQYGSEEGENVFYASKNKGTIKGVEEKTQMDWKDRVYNSLTEELTSDGKRELVGTVRGRQKGLKPHGGKGKVTTTHRDKKGKLVIVTKMPDGTEKKKTVK
jgi:hypothetical protein|tara:strand:+ start:88 stop:435 length:348 start_codon:yes stop_codon:yes gene_type:complete